jgi:hypothetical protein
VTWNFSPFVFSIPKKTGGNLTCGPSTLSASSFVARIPINDCLRSTVEYRCENSDSGTDKYLYVGVNRGILMTCKDSVGVVSPARIKSFEVASSSSSFIYLVKGLIALAAPGMLGAGEFIIVVG